MTELRQKTKIASESWELVETPDNSVCFCFQFWIGVLWKNCVIGRKRHQHGNIMFEMHQHHGINTNSQETGWLYYHLKIIKCNKNTINWINIKYIYNLLDTFTVTHKLNWIHLNWFASFILFTVCFFSFLSIVFFSDHFQKILFVQKRDI